MSIISKKLKIMSNFHILKSRGIIRNDNGDIFLAFIPKAGFFCLPGGTMEPGETFRACAEREIIEETGVKPIFGEEKYCYEFVNSRGDLQFEMWFEVTNYQDFEDFDKSCATHGFECSDEGFYSLETIKNMEVRPKNLTEILETKFSVL